MKKMILIMVMLGTLHTLAQHNFSNGYVVLDNINEPSLSAPNLGNTTGQERGIAYRSGTPDIIYVARGGTSTGDGRPGGVVGIAAIKLTAYGSSDYTDTGLLVSGGTPANFSFIQAIFYEPVLDKVWVLDGSGSSARVWYFDGGAVGGSPSGGGTAVTATATGITHLFQASNATSLGGGGRGLAVRVSGSTVTVALGMGSHLEVWESTTGLAGTYSQKFESSNDLDGAGSLCTALGTTSSSVRDVTFDENGDIWVVNAGGGNRSVFRFPFTSSGTGVIAGDAIALPSGSFDNTGGGANVNSFKIYVENTTVYALAGLRQSSPSTANNSGIVRFRRNGAAGTYSFTALDGFGVGITNTSLENSDAIMGSLQYKANAVASPTIISQPSGGTQALMYMSMPYSSSSTLQLSSRKFYVNAFVINTLKAQTVPTSAAIEVLLPPLNTFTKITDNSSSSFSPGSTNNLLLAFIGSTSRSAITVNSFRFNRTGGSTATDSEVDAVKVWEDANANNTFESGIDNLRGSGTMSSGVSTITLTGVTLTTSSKTFFVTVDVNPAAIGTLGLQLSTANVVTATKTDNTGTVENTGQSPLPVELSSFTSTVSGQAVNLSWSTATEVDNYGFEVQKSENQSDWSTIGFVHGSGNSNSNKQYAYTDQQAGFGTIYYRLKQIDNAGTFKVYDPITVEVEIPKDFTLSQNYPNPFNPATTINYTLPTAGGVTLQVYSMNGELVQTLVQKYQAAGSYSVTFDASGLASGTYAYRLITTGADGQTQSALKKMLLMK